MEVTTVDTNSIARPDEAGEDYTLISFIGVGNSPLIVPFIEHHRSLGVTRFQLILHGDWPDTRLDYLRDQNDVLIVEIVLEPYSEVLLREKYNSLIRRLRGQWVVLVDGDELLEIPYDNLREMAACMSRLGIDDLPAFMVQRLTGDGELAEPDPNGDINRQFAMMNFNLCEDLNTEDPTWKEKFPFFFVTPQTQSRRGNHLPPNGLSPTNAPVRAVLHHFKWTASFRAYIAAWQPGSGRGNNEEHAAYRTTLERTGFRLPTDSSIAYSRRALFEQGLLIRPTVQESEIASILAAVRMSREAPPPELYRRLDALSLAPADADDAMRSYTAPKNLLLAPGRICFVTFELPGPSKTGGIGTAVGALAESLAQLGHSVDIVFCPFRGEPQLAPLWWDFWRRRGVRVRYFPRSQFGGWYMEHDRFDERLNEVLGEMAFDVIHFVDAGGYHGRYARNLRSRYDAPGVRTVFTVHGPGDWHRRGNLIPWQSDEPLERASLTYSLELADMVVFPSHYMREWIREHYRLTAPNMVIPNVLSGLGRSFGAIDRRTRDVSEIVFFGRIEPRKGFDVFCRAIGELTRAIDSMPAITIMGRIGETLSGDWKRDFFGPLSDRVKHIGNYGNIDAINYLKTRACVAVVPSRRDNLPYTVYECVENGIPIMTSDVGGIRELIDPADHDRVLVAGDSASLAAALTTALRNGIAPAQPAFEASLANIAQLALHARLVAEARGDDIGSGSADLPNDPSIPQVRYGITAPARRGSVLDAAEMDSEVRLGDNWSRQINARVARLDSAFVLLQDKDVEAIEDDAAASMLRLQRAGDYDAVVSDCRITFHGAKGPRVRLNGGEPQLLRAVARPAEMSPMKNIYGAGWLLIKRQVFVDVGGFHEAVRDSRYAHWELLNRLQAEGYHLASVPRALVEWGFDDTSAWNAEPEHELVEHLLRPWLEGTTFHQQNMIRYAAGNLIHRERPWASLYKGFIQRQLDKARRVRDRFHTRRRG